MKGSMMWRLMYVFCALAGCLAGYGIFRLTGEAEIKLNTPTKDNTLVRESDDSVFFAGSEEAPVLPEVTARPTATLPEEDVSPAEIPEKSVELSPAEPELPPVTELPEAIERSETEPITQKPVAGQAVITVLPDTMPSLASQWAIAMPEVIPTPLPVITSSAAAETAEKASQDNTAEVITYPVEIFGQIPVINRSDAYVSYFEFAYDLIEMLEPEVRQRGLSMNSLLAKFAIKALFCGVDIEKLDINAPIPRRQAALCLWLAAQVLGEKDSDTSTKTAQKYVTDIGSCSSSEKKAVAYLYEQGILSGYQVAGQKFYPDAGLKTESGSIWLSGAKQCWK